LNIDEEVNDEKKVSRSDQALDTTKNAHEKACPYSDEKKSVEKK
jgi:hypothetical protein